MAVLRTNARGVTTVEEYVGTCFLWYGTPNPFNPETKINFQIPSTSDVTLKIYDLLGREVVTLVSERMNPGTYSASWNATGFASGVYLYRMRAGYPSTSPRTWFVKTRKLVLLN